MLQGNAYTYADDYLRYQGKAAGPRCQTRTNAACTPCTASTAAFHVSLVAAPTQQRWEALAGCAWSSRTSPRMPRFSSAAARAEHDDDLTSAS